MNSQLAKTSTLLVLFTLCGCQKSADVPPLTEAEGRSDAPQVSWRPPLPSPTSDASLELRAMPEASMPNLEMSDGTSNDASATDSMIVQTNVIRLPSIPADEAAENNVELASSEPLPPPYFGAQVTMENSAAENSAAHVASTTRPPVATNQTIAHTTSAPAGVESTERRWPFGGTREEDFALEGWQELARGPQSNQDLDPEPTIPADVLSRVTLPPPMAKQSAEIMKHATELANRGALYSAQKEFVRVLRLVAQSLDSELGQPYHTRALARGLRALEEADDFMSYGGSVDNDLQLKGFVAGHRTPVLKEQNLVGMTPLTAMQSYYEYAVPQLIKAGNREPVAADALYGLGRTHMLMSQAAGVNERRGPLPIALLQSSLAIDDRHADAANELGVLLARYGQLEKAEAVLQQSVAAHPRGAAVTNLAAVRNRLGLAATQSPSFAPPAATPAVDPGRILWMSPQEFAQSGSETLEPIPMTTAVPAMPSPPAAQPSPPMMAQPVPMPQYPTWNMQTPVAGPPESQPFWSAMRPTPTNPMSAISQPETKNAPNRSWWFR